MTNAAASGTQRGGTVRCAIYTRKSSEEGLEQEFNSLQAQREACEAFIASQRHEGWVCLATRYDDGGFSGATIDRPALQRLLADIAAGRVNTIVSTKSIGSPARWPILPRSSKSSMPEAHPLFRSRSSSTRRRRWGV
jgi:Resolvase, N terminal domain